MDINSPKNISLKCRQRKQKFWGARLPQFVSMATPHLQVPAQGLSAGCSLCAEAHRIEDNVDSVQILTESEEIKTKIFDVLSGPSSSLSISANTCTRC